MTALQTAEPAPPAAQAQPARRNVVNLVAFIVICGAATITALTLGVDRSWDLLNYHIYTPHAFATGRIETDVAAAFAQSYLNPAVDFLNLALFQAFNDHPMVIAAILGFLHGLNFFLVFLIARLVFSVHPRFEQYAATIFAVSMGATGAIVVSVLGITTNDLIVSLPALLGLYFLLLQCPGGQGAGAPPRRLRRWLLVSGACFGLAAGLKLTMLMFGLAAVIAILMVGTRGTGRLLALVHFMGAAAFVMSATVGYHAIYLTVQFGSPIFPFANDLFQSPYAPPNSFRDERFLPGSFLEGLTYPFRWMSTTQGLSTELAFRDWRFSFAWASTILIALHWFLARIVPNRLAGIAADQPRRQIGHRAAFLIVFWLTGLCLGIFLFGISRYLVTVELLNGIVLALGFLLFAHSTSGVLAVAIASIGVFSATTQYFSWGREDFGDKFLFADFGRLPEGSTIFVRHSSPIGFVVPFLPAKTQVMRFDNYMVKLKDNNIFARRTRDRLRDRRAARFLLVMDGRPSANSPSTKLPFNLTIAVAACRSIRTNVGAYKEKLWLCPILSPAAGAPDKGSAPSR